MQVTHNMMGTLREKVGLGNPFDMNEYTTKIAYDVIGRAAFSTDFGATTSDEKHPFYRRAGKKPCTSR